MKLIYNAINHCGKVRSNNEDTILVGNQILRDSTDSFSFDIPEGSIVVPAIVCDGVGGNERGEEASMAVCEYFRDFFAQLPTENDESELIMSLKHVAASCNNKILEKAQGCGMASTLTGMVILGDKALVLNAGDSRTYRLRYDHLKLLTREHTTQRADGRRVLTNCFGLEEITLDITTTAIVPGDTFIVCSDGLFDMIPDEVISANATDAEKLLNAALNAGGYDNISIITIQFSDDSESFSI